MAKGLTNGAVPMGAVAASKQIYDTFMQGPEGAIELFHGYTYSAHPVACAAGIATQEIYRKEGLLDARQRDGGYWADGVHSLKGLPHVIDLRNLGLIGAIELEPIPGKPGARGYDTFVRAFEKGLLVRVTGDIIAMSPPLIIEKQHVDQVFGILAEVLREIALAEITSRQALDLSRGRNVDPWARLQALDPVVFRPVGRRHDRPEDRPDQALDTHAPGRVFSQAKRLARCTQRSWGRRCQLEQLRSAVPPRRDSKSRTGAADARQHLPQWCRTGLGVASMRSTCAVRARICAWSSCSARIAMRACADLGSLRRGVCSVRSGTSSGRAYLPFRSSGEVPDRAPDPALI